MSLRRAVALGLGVVLTAAVVPERVVWAQAVPAEGPEALARADFEAGVRHARAQRWAEALAAFERSRARVDQPPTALNVAVAQRELGRLRAARQTLRACLAMPQTAADGTLGRASAPRRLNRNIALDAAIVLACSIGCGFVFSVKHVDREGIEVSTHVCERWLTAPCSNSAKEVREPRSYPDFISPSGLARPVPLFGSLVHFSDG